MYSGLIGRDLTENAMLDVNAEGKKLNAVYTNVLNNCGRNGELARAVRLLTGDDSIEQLESDNHYYVDGTRYNQNSASPTSKIKNTYNWVGGYIFYQGMLAVKKVGAKDLFGLNTSGEDTDTESLIRIVMPYVVLMCAYVPDSEKYLKKAEILKEKNVPDDSIGIDNIMVPGTVEGARLFLTKQMRTKF